MHQVSRCLQPGWFQLLSPLAFVNIKQLRASQGGSERWGVVLDLGLLGAAAHPGSRSPCAQLVFSRALLRAWRPAWAPGVFTCSEAWAVWGFWGPGGRGTIQHGSGAGAQ